ncbi:MAG: arylsulfatase [Prolixibacteraceae bacterium]
MRTIFKNGIPQFSLFLLLVFVLSGCQNKPSGNLDSAAQKPNIVFILADDLGYGDLSCYGQEKFQTPNIDRLANEGLLFAQHYAGSTVCSPSRSSLLTGQHTGHTFIRGNVGVKPEGQYPLEDKAVTVAELLKSAGYVTGAFGKWGLGPTGSEGAPNKQGFDEFYGYACQTLAHNYYPHHLWHNEIKIELSENDSSKLGVYAPDLIHQQALSFIDQHKDTSFFLFYPTTIPHAELAAPATYMQKFSGKLLPEISYEGADEGAPRYKTGGYGSQPEVHAAFAAMLTLLDDQVGEIEAKLKELGIADNTIIIFTSDNGPHVEGGADPDYFNSNGPLTGYKRDLTEGGIREPMLVVWPAKIKPGTQSDHVSAFWDFLPTVCDLLNIDQPDYSDGISFLPTLLGENQPEHDFLYWEFHEQGGKQAVRLGNWKGIRLNMDENPTAPVALYNLEADLAEQHNIAAEHPDIVKKISEIMQKEHTRSEVFSFGYESNEKKFTTTNNERQLQIR